MKRIAAIPHIQWLLFSVVVLIPVIVWLQTYNWRLTLTIPAVFPLLGVLAWSIMWTHYANGWLQIKHPEKIKKNQLYSSVSTWLVLGLLLLHPGLLAWQQYRLFGTLPPESFFATVATNLEPFVAIAIFALILFLAYEIVHRLKEKPAIKRASGWISISQVIAMILIFIHGLAVGQTVLSGWMELWWIFLGILLLPAFFEVVKADWQNQKKQETTIVVNRT